MLSVRVGIESVQVSIHLMPEVFKSTCKLLSLVSEPALEVLECLSWC